ncbi:MAG: hypothetical protein NZQ09_10575 [Chloroflexus sp.]|nr:hypothetical protein [Chloroflexus sp.]
MSEPLSDPTAAPGDTPPELVRVHRIIGYARGRIMLHGIEHLVIEVMPQRYEVAPAHLAQPVDRDAALGDLRIALADIALLARWRGLEPAAVIAALTALLAEGE